MYRVTQWIPQDRSGKVCWLLHELGLDFEVQKLNYEVDHKNPEYRKHHPLGGVPVLYDLASGASFLNRERFVFI